MKIRAVLIVGMFACGVAQGDPVVFGTPTRTRDYSGWMPATRGDINTVGMSGATLALATSISAAQWNPAGYAMETQSVAAQVLTTTYQDKRIQPTGQPIDALLWGLGVSLPSWGFAVAYYSPMTESGRYISQQTGHALDTEVSIKKYELMLANSTLFDGALALGAGISLVKGVRELGPYDYNETGVSWQAGALVRLPHRLIIGVGFEPLIEVGPADSGPAQDELPGFNRAVYLPSRFGLGLGWYPNRFFKVGVSLLRAGATTATGLLSDERVTTGAIPTLVPRLGASYVWIEYRNFKSELAVGSYFEQSRLSGQSNRVHATAGLDVNPYFVNLGAGFDFSRGYRNLTFSVGVDIVRLARFLQIIPPEPVPPLQKTFPKPGQNLPDGLPEPLTRGTPGAKRQPSLGEVKDIIKNIPNKLEEKMSGKKQRDR